LLVFPGLPHSSPNEAAERQSAVSLCQGISPDEVLGIRATISALYLLLYGEPERNQTWISKRVRFPDMDVSFPQVPRGFWRTKVSSPEKIRRRAWKSLT